MLFPKLNNCLAAAAVVGDFRSTSLSIWISQTSNVIYN